MSYFDNAATSYPKPDEVYSVLIETMRNKGGNPGRGSHRMAIEAFRAVYETRVKLAKLFNIDDPLRIAFTQNATMSLNFAIKGVLEKGDHVITTSLEHNSVLRPLFSMEEQKKIDLTIVEADYQGLISLDDIEKSIQENTKAIVITHASNLTGTIIPIEKIGEIAKKHGILLIVDASQSAGILEIDVNKMNIDILCFTGHKSLFGPQGTGGIYLRKGVEIKPLMEGGSGSHSKLKRQPQEMPDLLECGTLNAPGIAALGAGVDFILKTGMENIRKHEDEITEVFIKGVKGIEGVRVYGPETGKRTPVVALNIGDIDPAELSAILDEEYDIAVRPGMHCAPLAHKSIGTYETGAVRFSFGYFNTSKEITEAITAVKEISDFYRDK
ncbi:aminotransferase class V-fold PLP-dependent enzyme [Ilyobacter polytropus]|uniref:cysteine desulfurase n=1 Tax=Ilyobacter polytropus (strain ATCC 51220 / DSM 2926 / LMG 16218 / CuHBu1) TaxID=572544 RepID=E3HCN5_ILYPC|nr:aminotransferase class V-fold PLP-dependent enzyme [Ilyobacter polytropus]ADO84430.1 cysteine desulfurase family protein [Ilyobacter polytropus DSM 2926]